MQKTEGYIAGDLAAALLTVWSENIEVFFLSDL